MTEFPTWLNTLCAVSVATGILCALVILFAEFRHPNHMVIMRIVWPVCALFGTVFVLWLFFRYGREVVHPSGGSRENAAVSKMPAVSAPFAITVAKGTLHCGGGCAIGDIIAEWLAFAMPAVAIAFGWHTVFEEKTYAVWVLDFIIAFGIGIIFQYFAIVPMRKLSVGQGIVAALKADTLSLAAWQIGMYCLMAVMQFIVFERLFGGPAPVNSVEFWVAMQLAMIAGFATSYPMNWWLIRVGIKEPM